jgi:serine/threonine protein kinase/tetratricopeptide (TPR) repeat protein
MTLASGTRLGPYRILAPIGAGGMGEVYRARDEKLDRDVAIKVLPESVAADPDTLARFEREAKAVAALSHPNILAIHDFGTHGGVSYAVMELLEGQTLREKLLSGPVPPKQAVDYAVQLARGLSAAHDKGVVHRDLKPENLFVTRDGHVKILDFGLAKRVEAVAPGMDTNAPTRSDHTEPGTVMGTVGYMSPEQVRGLPIDHRSDIFSFGAVLYELLFGKKAFDRSTASDAIAAILKEEPPALPGRDVPVALDHVVRHCLEKDRDHRFQSARDVAFALEQASSSPVTTVPAVAARPPRSRFVPAAAAVFLAVAVIALLVLRRTPAAPAGAPTVQRVAVLPFENLGSPEDDYFADGIADEIRAKLTSLSGVEVIARGSSTPYKKTTKSQTQIAGELGVGYLLTATVRWQKSAGASRVQVTPELVEVRKSGAPASKWQESFDAALTDVFQVQSDIASRVASALGVALRGTEEQRLLEKPTRNLAAYDAFLKGQEIWKSLAVGDPPALRRALSFYDQAVALDPAFAQAWARISWANSSLYMNSAPTPEVAERAREAAEKAATLAPDAPEGYHALGNYRRLVLKDYGGALEQYTKGQRLAPGNADLLTATALAEESLGRWAAAVEHLRQAERLDPRSIPQRLRLGQALLYLRRYPEARQALDRGLDLAPANLALISEKAMTFLGEGDLAGARKVIAAVPKEVEPAALVAYLASLDLVWVLDGPQREVLLRLTPGAFNDDRPAWALALLQAAEGDAAKRRNYAGEAVKALEEQLRAAPDDALRRAARGVALAHLGRREEAIHEGKRSAALSPVAEDSNIGTVVQHQLALVYILAGEPEKALDNLEPLLRIPYFLSPGWLKIDPSFDPLRNNPRFQKLVAGVA